MGGSHRVSECVSDLHSYNDGQTENPVSDALTLPWKLTYHSNFIYMYEIKVWVDDIMKMKKLVFTIKTFFSKNPKPKNSDNNKN